MTLTAEQSDKLVDYMINNVIKKQKGQFINVEGISKHLKERLGDKYTSDIGIAVRQALLNSDKVEFFKEHTYIHEQKFVYCVGNWLTLKNLYNNPIEMKAKVKMESWQLHQDDESYLD